MGRLPNDMRMDPSPKGSTSVLAARSLEAMEQSYRSVPENEPALRKHEKDRECLALVPP